MNSSVRAAVGATSAAVLLAACSGGAEPPAPADAANGAVPLEAEIFFELNATARDAGVQMLVDGEGWESITVTTPGGGKQLTIRAEGSVGDIGVTELAFESAEPTLDDLPLDQLLAKFPEGEYTVDGTTVDGKLMAGVAQLTHDIPPAANVVVPGTGQRTARGSTVIDWQPVTAPGMEITGYQVIVEREDPLRVFSVDVPAGVTKVAVPAEYLEPGTDYKLEVIAVERGHNQTITETEFSVAG